MSLRVTQSHTAVLGSDLGKLRVSQTFTSILMDRHPERALVSECALSDQVAVTKTLNRIAASDLYLQQQAQCINDGGPFVNALEFLRLNEDTQGAAAVVHALLQYAAEKGQRGETQVFDNPLLEVLRRLEETRINPHALEFIRQFLGPHIDAYQRGRR